MAGKLFAFALVYCASVGPVRNPKPCAIGRLQLDMLMMSFIPSLDVAHSASGAHKRRGTFPRSHHGYAADPARQTPLID